MSPPRLPISPATARLLLWPLLLAATLLTVSNLPVTPMLPDVGWEGFDKVAHFLYYGLLGTLFVRVRAVQKGEHRVLLAWLATAFVAVADEWRQSMNPERTFELADALADFAGASVAIVLYAHGRAYRRFLEHRLFTGRS